MAIAGTLHTRLTATYLQERLVTHPAALYSGAYSTIATHHHHHLLKNEHVSENGLQLQLPQGKAFHPRGHPPWSDARGRSRASAPPAPPPQSWRTGSTGYDTCTWKGACVRLFYVCAFYVCMCVRTYVRACVCVCVVVLFCKEMPSICRLALSFAWLSFLCVRLGICRRLW